MKMHNRCQMFKRSLGYAALGAGCAVGGVEYSAGWCVSHIADRGPYGAEIWGQKRAYLCGSGYSRQA
jgi:hypothetical protein